MNTSHADNGQTYITANGTILRGNAALHAMIEADMHQLEKEIPPAPISLTLRQPNHDSNQLQPAEICQNPDLPSSVNVTSAVCGKNSMPLSNRDQESKRAQDSRSRIVASGQSTYQKEDDKNKPHVIDQGTSGTTSLRPDINTKHDHDEAVTGELLNRSPGTVDNNDVDEESQGSAAKSSLHLNRPPSTDGNEDGSRAAESLHLNRSPNTDANEDGSQAAESLLHLNRPPSIDDDEEGSAAESSSHSVNELPEQESDDEARQRESEVESENETNSGQNSTKIDKSSIEIDTNTANEPSESNSPTDHDTGASSEEHAIINDDNQSRDPHTHEVSIKRGKISAKAAAALSEIKISKNETKPNEIKKAVSALASAKGAVVEVNNQNVVNVKLEASANAKAQATAVDVKARNKDASGVTAKVSANAEASAKGASLQVLTNDMGAVSLEGKGSAEASAKGVTLSAGNTDSTLAKGNVKASVSVSTNAAKIQAGAASLTGIEASATASASANARGTDIKAGKLDVKGAEIGASASATAEATGLDVKAGTATVSGAKISASASASASVGFEAKVANANVSGFDGVGANVSVSAKPGIKTLNVNAGVSGQTGIRASAAFEVSNVVMRPGLPGLSLAPALNFGFGGGGGGESRGNSGEQNGSSGSSGNSGNGGSSGNSGNGGSSGNSGSSGDNTSGSSNFRSGRGGGGRDIERDGNIDSGESSTGGQGSASLTGGIQGGSGTGSLAGGIQRGGSGTGSLAGGIQRGGSGTGVLTGGIQGGSGTGALTGDIQGRSGTGTKKRGSEILTGEKSKPRGGIGRGQWHAHRSEGTGNGSQIVAGSHRQADGVYYNKNYRQQRDSGVQSQDHSKYGKKLLDQSQGGKTQQTGHYKGIHRHSRNGFESLKGSQGTGCHGLLNTDLSKGQVSGHGLTQQNGHSKAVHNHGGNGQNHISVTVQASRSQGTSNGHTVHGQQKYQHKQKDRAARHNGYGNHSVHQHGAQGEKDGHHNVTEQKKNGKPQLTFHADFGSQANNPGLSLRRSRYASTNNRENVVDDWHSKDDDKPPHLKLLDQLKNDCCRSHSLSSKQQQPNGKLDPNNEMRPGATATGERKPTDGERLTARVSEKYAHLFSEVRQHKSPSDEKKEPKKISASREGALADARKTLHSALKQLQQIRSTESQQISRSNSNTDSLASNQTENEQQTVPERKAKPLGSRGHIHTLDSLKAQESSRPMVSIGGSGRIVGFGNNN